MSNTIEHQAALARIEEMRRYADATRRHARTEPRRSGFYRTYSRIRPRSRKPIAA